jgi:hypothetical protein
MTGESRSSIMPSTEVVNNSETQLAALPACIFTFTKQKQALAQPTKEWHKKFNCEIRKITHEVQLMTKKQLIKTEQTCDYVKLINHR